MFDKSGTSSVVDQRQWQRIRHPVDLKIWKLIRRLWRNSNTSHDKSAV